MRRAFLTIENLPDKCNKQILKEILLKTEFSYDEK